MAVSRNLCGNCKYYGRVPAPRELAIPSGQCFYFNFHPVPDSVKGVLAVDKEDGKYCAGYEENEDD